jgi:cation-transporting P-type ATPase F
MESLLGHHWHHLPAEDVLDLLDSHGTRGLDEFEVRRRREYFGPNLVSVAPGKSPLVRFLLQFHQPLVYILILSGLVTAALKGPVDAAVILGVVVINAAVGYLQESKAEQAIGALSARLATETTVVRAGERRRVPSADLVPGDLLLLQAGDRVPADIRLTHAKDLQADESALTGESVPVPKQPDTLPHDIVMADRKNMVYGSALITYGQGLGVVVATGDRSEIGRISGLITAATDLETPLTRKIARFTHTLVGVILAFGGLTFAVGAWRGEPLVDTLLAAVTLVVAVIPEGLPAAVTITLAIGVARMARRHVIIRKLPAVETLGSTTVICSDKTGTLTENQMTVKEILAGGDRYEVAGAGYAPQGGILQAGQPVTLEGRPALRECLLAGLLCNDATLDEAGGRFGVHGDPTEGALVVSARKAGLEESLREALPRLDLVPFDSQHQYMATLHETGPGRPRVVYVKGAVEPVLDRCGHALARDGAAGPLDAAAVHASVDALAAHGLRVLALARRELPPGSATIGHTDVAADLTFAGLQGMIDPPRPEAVAAVKACRAAGVAVKMITGDHPVTAAAIAREIGLIPPSMASTEAAVITGRAMQDYTDAELTRAVQETAVFARVTPEQKLRLVAALQAQGHIVAMTGDGVNDAPALKHADIGVAMGITGTDVAKGAADAVLTDDNFASIEAAVEEGRAVFANLTKFIIWTLPTNVGQGLVILVAVLLGETLPILPVQVLWINMTTALLLGLMLAFEPAEPEIMARPPRDPKVPILSGELIFRIASVGLILLAGGFGLFEWELLQGRGVDEARTAAVTVFVVVQMFYLFNCRSLTQSVFRIGLASNPLAIAGSVGMLLLQIGFVYLPVMNDLFHTAPMPPVSWAWVAAVGLAAFAMVGIEKRLRHGGSGGVGRATGCAALSAEG